MAISQVRAQIAGTWYVLSYNAGTGYYEADIAPTASSVNLPGGYYNVTVEAVNDSGDTVSVNGDTFKSLRLVAREVVPPVLALVSPAQGILTTDAPTIVVTVTDNDAGVPSSGLSATLDGAAVPFTAAGITGGWTVTVPLSGLSEGAHGVRVTAEDRDGNSGAISLSYTVDTKPPELALYLRGVRRVVDEDSITFSGLALDATTGVSSLIITGGAETVTATPGADGVFTARIPLAIGVNDLWVTATDIAGWSAVEGFRVIRVITDRTKADPPSVESYHKKPVSDWTAAEKQGYALACLRGAYDEIAENRVGAAVALLAQRLDELGIQVQAEGKTDWAQADGMRAAESAAYLSGVRVVREKMPGDVYLPQSMDALDWYSANLIEIALVDTDAWAIMPQKSWIASGEGMCGEF